MASHSADVKLLGAKFSPFVLRILFALNLKSIKYELIEQDLRSKSELLLKSNPVHKKVPVLIHGDLPVCESLVILQYIDEAWTHGPQILPSDPYDRALARFWASYVDEKWFPSVRGIMMSDGEDQKKNIEEAIEGAALMEESFLALSNGRKFFAGERIGFLDIVIGCCLPWMDVISRICGVKLIDEIKTPNLCKWAQEFTSDPAVTEHMPDVDELMEYAKYIIALYKPTATN